MSKSERIDLLVRAFKAAWDHYFRPDRNTEVLECLARPALAEFLVQKVRQGVHDEPSLAAAGLEFLFSLEDQDGLQEEPVHLSPEDSSPEDFVDECDVWGKVHLENASAHFLRVEHVSIANRMKDQWQSNQRARLCSIRDKNKKMLGIALVRSDAPDGALPIVGPSPRTKPGIVRVP